MKFCRALPSSFARATSGICLLSGENLFVRSGTTTKIHRKPASGKQSHRSFLFASQTFAPFPEFFVGYLSSCVRNS
jgi:hypothetical protein